MKRIIFIMIFQIVNQFAISQISVNPYDDYSLPNKPYPSYINSQQQELFTTFNSIKLSYTGEYEIYVADFFWWNFFPSNAITYKHEVVGFPFTLKCLHLAPFDCRDCNNPSPERNLYMPTQAFDYSLDRWGDYLTRKSEMGLFLSGGNSYYPTNLGFHKYTNLISAKFTKIWDPNWAIDHSTMLPHTAIKTTLFLHCNSSPNSDVISKISFTYDNTRGRMRDYPFSSNNCTSSEADHDVTFRPKIIVPLDENLDYDDAKDNSSWTEQSGTINYFKFSEIITNNCIAPPIASDIFYNYNGLSFGFPYLSPTSLIASPLYEEEASTLAGYLNVNSQTTQLINNVGIRQNYFIDNNFELTLVNPVEMTIFNPSEVTITSGANNLHFPSYHTFKTINGVLPYKSKVLADSQDPQCGGPYTDLRNVPVRTDLRSENPNDPNDPNNPDHSVFASRYYLEGGSKLTIDACCNIYDAAFDVNEGATLIFENHPTNLGYEDKSNHV
ncbi:MAG: hypothetical protein IPO27_01430 [Bacteroidetes bacterium]|nr:hypothetical protein [Bacteroidota bacterium]